MTKKSNHINKEETDNSVPEHIEGKVWRNNGEAKKQKEPNTEKDKDNS